jgi:hypothetical protein
LSTWSRNNQLALSAILATVLVPAAIAFVFFYAPVDEDGLNQKIFSSISGRGSRAPISRATSPSTSA